MSEEEKSTSLPVLEADRVDLIGIPAQGSGVLRVWTEVVTEAEGEGPAEASFDFLVTREALVELRRQIDQALQEMAAIDPQRPPNGALH